MRSRGGTEERSEKYQDGEQKGGLVWEEGVG